MEEQTIHIKSDNQTANLLFEGNNLFTSNTLLHYACLDYMKNYKSNLVPFNYIRFYLSTFKSYDRLFQRDLRDFFGKAEIESLDILLLASVYTKSLTTIAVSIVNNDSLSFLLTDKDPADLLSFYMESESKNEWQFAIYSNIKVIVKEMDKSDELLTKKELFERFMIDRFLDDYTPTNIIKKKTTKQEKEIKKHNPDKKHKKETETKIQQSLAPEMAKYNESMKGKEVEVPKEKGKVNKLFIPKLMLPTAYPILNDASRVNSDYRSKNLLKAYRMIDMFSRYKFKAIIYSAGFIEKRKKTKKPKPKFSFDF